MKRPRILYERGTIEKMAKAFGVTGQTVRNALRFISEGELADKIRKEALEYYGCVLTKKDIKI
ncbi:MAG: hypothetical protein NC410_09280 [Oscillibacter sp.]|nr:hypothetical protein [Oscillibacter sp.]